MMTEKDPLDVLVEAASEANKINEELRRLRGIELWAIKQMGFKVGDKVVIKKTFAPIEPGSGWYHYREVLVPGATGTITSLMFAGGGWMILYRPDVEWGISDWGFKQPRKVFLTDPDRYHSFMMAPEDLRLRRASDKPLVAPEAT